MEDPVAYERRDDGIAVLTLTDPRAGLEANLPRRPAVFEAR